MKLKRRMLGSIALFLFVTACSLSTNKEQDPLAMQGISTDEILIAYFSLPETDTPMDMSEEEENSTVVIDGEVLGNTQYFARIIQSSTKGAIFRIEPQIPYPTAHDELVEAASVEKAEQTRPAIKGEITDFERYKVVFVGYPNWWGDMPMILYSFFDRYDFSDKIIIPFNTHGGSGFSNTISTIQRLEPDATVLDQGLSISRNEIADAENEILTWLDSLAIEHKK